jgi:hypothetical protein
LEWETGKNARQSWLGIVRSGYGIGIGAIAARYTTREEKQMNCNYLIGVKMDNRVANAQCFQETLTRNGCSIKTRLGMHEVDEETCATYGIIVLQPCGEKADIEQLAKALNALEGITAKVMDLNEQN